jgi:hypothetical protein
MSRDVPRDHEPGLEPLHHASSLIGSDGPVALSTVALPTATYPLS